MSIKTYLTLVFTIFFSLSALGQAIQNSSTYLSDLDSNLTIKKIALLPVTDNVNGVYSRPVEERLRENLVKNHQFVSVDPKFAGALVTPQDLESSPDQVKKLSEGLDTDALISVRATKLQTGVTLHLDLFLKKDGTLIAQQILKDQPNFETTQVQAKATQLLERAIKQIPYDGLVMSRTENRVTLNLGKRNGVKPDQIVTAILLINLNRHPKFNFIISSEKEVLGKVKITKVEETLSFGQIITEKGIGTIRKDTKISGVDFVNYEEPISETSKADEKLQKVAFGENPQEWKPSKPPTFGKVGAGLGIGQYAYKRKLSNGTAQEATSGFYPSVKVGGELWLTPKWIANFDLQQGIISDPAISISSYTLTAGYNFLLKNNDFFGPSIQLVLGFSSYSSFVDDTNTSGLTSTKYSGFLTGVRGSVPLTDDKVWNLGATFDLFLGTSLRETPVTSGSKYDNTINRFSLFGFYQSSTRTRIKAGIEFSSFSTSFSGTGSAPVSATTTSQVSTIFNGGMEYLF